MMEADLKAQAATAMGLLCGISHASLPLEFIDLALRTIQETDSAIRPQVQPDAAVQRLTSSHSLAFATREVAELELSVEAAITVVSTSPAGLIPRWMDCRGCRPTRGGSSQMSWSLPWPMPVRCWRQLQCIGCEDIARLCP
nr:uncharacterized protein LOC120974402 [Aegilops tauschii subsp. strangulata]